MGVGLPVRIRDRRAGRRSSKPRDSRHERMFQPNIGASRKEMMQTGVVTAPDIAVHVP